MFNFKSARWLAVFAVGSTLVVACGDDSKGGSNPNPPVPEIVISAGNNQQAEPGQAAATALVVTLSNNGVPAANEPVAWVVESGDGDVSTDTVLTGADGKASITWTLGPAVGGNGLRAVWPDHDSVTFHATATGEFTVAGGGNNVTERYTSDLWVADGFAYSGTWGTRVAGTPGNAVKIWQLNGGGAPTLTDSIITTQTGTISDIQVSDDGHWLVFTAEGGGAGGNPGIHVYELTTPGHPVFRAKTVVSSGLHTGALATIGGTLYAFTAKDPASCALQIYNLSAAATGTITLASATPIPDHYCIHDTFVRDGYAFVFAWDEGLYIFDVGNGSHAGSPTSPQLISHTGSQANPKFGGQTHNGWWYWSPSGAKRYLFIGEEGPAVIGGGASGDIHVVDVSDFTNPVEVASYNLPGAGTHNFWVDETREILYAAYYNGGVVALDISGTLSGNLASREIAKIQPGGAGDTFTWGVMLYNGSVYASDMLSGLWQLHTP